MPSTMQKKNRMTGQNHQALSPQVVTCSVAAATAGQLTIKISRDPTNQPTARTRMFNIESTFQKNVYK
jgi:hypothetical protein